MHLQAALISEINGADGFKGWNSFYLRLKGDGKDKVFVRAAQRNAASVIEVLGDRPINDYASSEAGKLRDALLNRGLAVTSIKRMFGSVKAIINLAMAEHGIEGRNPFASIYMPDERPEERQPVPLDAIRRIQRECMNVDDENRWLLALISDTGMRLSEAAGLAGDDILLDTAIPHINVRHHPWRRLKTKGSERLVPLVGASLWAAERGNCFLINRPSRINRPDLKRDIVWEAYFKPTIKRIAKGQSLYRHRQFHRQ